MRDKTVLIKGKLGGLQVYIGEEANLARVKELLHMKLKSSRHFFKGTAVNLTFTGKALSEAEQQEMTDFISKKIQIGSVEFFYGSQGDVDLGSTQSVFDGIEEGMTRFIRGTVRNGQRISYEGNIVIIGDVNPGGEVIAGGNIMVLGTLRGMAHAGATGNNQAVVAAFCLQPTQLRIGGIITRSPEGNMPKPSYPEIAHIKDDNLVIEPYQCLRGK